MRRAIPAILIAIVVLGQTAAFVRPASAAYIDSVPLDQQVNAYLYYYAWVKCADNTDKWDGGGPDISVDRAVSGQWFATATGLGEEDAHVSYLNSSNGIMDCNKSDIVNNGLSAWGFDAGNKTSLLEYTFGFKLDGDTYKAPEKYRTALFSTIRKQAFGGNTPYMSPAAKYKFYSGNFLAACSPEYIASPTPDQKNAADGGGSNTYVRMATDYDAVSKKTTYSYYKLTNGGTAVTTNEAGKEISNMLGVAYGDDGKVECKTLVDSANRTIKDFIAYLKTHPDEQKINPQATGATSTSGGEGAPTCSAEIGAVGWMVCPVMTFMAKLNDGFFTFISDNFLSIRVGLFSTSSGTYQAWTIFRNYANIAFVIVFLIIIYSQVTSAGISNYGIKRMLPKLIVSAILVNVSFYLCQAAVDLSNLLGYGIKALFDSITIGGGGAVKEVPKWVNIVGMVLIGAGAVAGVVGLVLAISASVLLAALLAFLMIVLILVAREALVVLLIVVAPLAFVANMLPNTEGLYKKWFGAFKTVLMVFPVISLLFGASMLAARVVSASAGPVTEGSSWQVFTLQLTAIGLTAIPLFAAPAILKGAMAAAGGVGAKLSGWGDRSTKGLSNNVKNKTYAGAYMQQRSKIRNANRLQGYSKGIKGAISRSSLTGAAGSQLGAMGTAMASKEEREAVDNEIVRLQKQTGWTEDNRLENAQKTFVSAMKAGDTTTARAAQEILMKGGNAGIGALQEGYTQLESDQNYEGIMGGETGQKVLSDMNSSGLKPKNAALAKLAYSKAGTKVTDLASDAKTYSALTDAEMSGQAVAEQGKPPKNFDLAVASGGITPVRAQEMLDNPDVSSNLSEDKKRVLRGIAAGGTPQPSAQSPTAPQSPQTPPGQLNVPHPTGGGAPTPPPSPSPGPTPPPTPPPSGTPPPVGSKGTTNPSPFGSGSGNSGSGGTP